MYQNETIVTFTAVQENHYETKVVVKSAKAVFFLIKRDKSAITNTLHTEVPSHYSRSCESQL